VDDPTATASSSCCRDDVDGAVENTKAPAPPAVVVAESPVQQLPDSFAGFGPTDAELREFAADMEALLGQGLGDSNELDESFYMESLGLMTTQQAEDVGRVKMEPNGSVISRSRSESAPEFCPAELMMKPEASSAEVLDIDFNCSSPTVMMDNEDEDSFEQKASASNGGDAAAGTQFLKRSLDLSLNYEAIIESWGSSLWTDGQRPNVQLDDFWPHAHLTVRDLRIHTPLFLVLDSIDRARIYICFKLQLAIASTIGFMQGLLRGTVQGWMAGGGRLGGEAAVTPRLGMGGGREARVTRYREKRRTRLFAKKIRYEVRKLNAEKRPRMKGRFVKRPAAAGGGATIAASCAIT
jgi:hypothetical protein